jgi:hypothetical protein
VPTIATERGTTPCSTACSLTTWTAGRPLETCGGRRIAEAWARGEAMTADDAVAFAKAGQAARTPL